MHRVWLPEQITRQIKRQKSQFEESEQALGPDSDMAGMLA